MPLLDDETDKEACPSRPSLLAHAKETVSVIISAVGILTFLFVMHRLMYQAATPVVVCPSPVAASCHAALAERLARPSLNPASDCVLMDKGSYHGVRATETGTCIELPVYAPSNGTDGFRFTRYAKLVMNAGSVPVRVITGHGRTCWEEWMDAGAIVDFSLDLEAKGDTCWRPTSIFRNRVKSLRRAAYGLHTLIEREFHTSPYTPAHCAGDEFAVLIEGHVVCY